MVTRDQGTVGRGDGSDCGYNTWHEGSRDGTVLYLDFGTHTILHVIKLHRSKYTQVYRKLNKFNGLYQD